MGKNLREKMKVTKDDLRVAIGKNLSDARLNSDAKLTQEDIAQMFRPPVSRAAVALWEVGETLPDIDKLVVLSKAYGCTIDALVFGDDEPIRRDGAITPDVLKIARAIMKLDLRRRSIIATLVESMT